MTRIRMNPDDRKALLLQHALTLAARNGIKAVTRVAIAKAAGATDGLINRYFGKRSDMVAAIVAEAVKTKNVPVCMRALQDGWRLDDAPRQLLRDAKALLAKQQ